MSNLDDLRTTLGQHAEELHDTEQYVRPVAVRARIRAVRRRRATGVAAAVAVLVVTGVAGVGALRQPQSIEPAGTSLFGLDVPETWSVNEFPYELERTATFGGDSDRIRLSGDEDSPARAVSLYSSGLGTGSATLYSDGEAIARTRGAEDAEVPVTVSNMDTNLTVRLDGAPTEARAAVAVYTATDELAEGVSNGTAVFRQVVAGSELVAAGFAEDGESEVTTTFRGRLSEARFADYCVATEKGLQLRVEIDDDGPIVGPCQTSAARDAGSSWSSFEDRSPAQVHTVHAYLTRPGSKVPVESADTELGVGVYTQPGESVRVEGLNVDPVTEYGGRTWRLVRAVPGESLTLDVGNRDRLIGFVAQGEMLRLTWDGQLTKGGSSYVSSDSGVARLVGGVLLSGDTYDVRLIADEGEVERGSMLVYRPE